MAKQITIRQLKANRRWWNDYLVECEQHDLAEPFWKDRSETARRMLLIISQALRDRTEV